MVVTFLSALLLSNSSAVSSGKLQKKLPTCVPVRICRHLLHMHTRYLHKRTVLHVHLNSPYGYITSNTNRNRCKREPRASTQRRNPDFKAKDKRNNKQYVGNKKHPKIGQARTAYLYAFGDFSYVIVATHAPAASPTHRHTHPQTHFHNVTVENKISAASTISTSSDISCVC